VRRTPLADAQGGSHQEAGQITATAFGVVVTGL
jgi:hypothetical protein